MSIAGDFQSIGLNIEDAAAQLDSREPLCLAHTQLSDGSYLAMGAAEVELFEIRAGAPEGPSNLQLQAPAWQRAVAALVAGRERCELVQVLASSSNNAGEGQAVRFGWVALGRGDDAFLAGSRAERTVRRLTTIWRTYLEYATVGVVHDGDVLWELVEPLFTPYVRAVRKQPWQPVLGIRRGVHEPPRLQVALRPWPCAALPWAPLVEVIGQCRSATALAVHIETPVKIGPDMLRVLENEVLRVNETLGGLLDAPAQEAIARPGRDELHEALLRRLEALRRPCIAMEPYIVSSEPVAEGLAGIVASVLTPPDASQGDNAVSPLVHGLRLETVAVGQGAPFARFGPGDWGRVLTVPVEAPVVLRAPESPVDERSALPCSRARNVPLRVLPQDGTTIGRASCRGREGNVRLDQESRLRHVYVVGQTGTGKSTLLLSMAEQDIANGHGVTVLDPHGTLVEGLLAAVPPERHDDVVVVDLSRDEGFVPLNPLRIDESEPIVYQRMRDAVIDEFMDTFDTLYDLRASGGPMFERYFRTFLVLLLGSSRPDDYTPMLPMIETLMNDKSLAQTLAGRFGDDDAFAAQALRTALNARGDASLANVVPYVVSKLTKFVGQSTARRVLCQRESIDFGDILGNNRILLINLSPAFVGSDAARLISRQVIMRLRLTAMRMGGCVTAKPHYIYADEFHHYASEHFAMMLSEIRKFGVGLVLAHQYTSQLVSDGNGSILQAILGNVGTVVTFRVGMDDARLLGNVVAPRAAADDIASLPNYATFVRSSGALGNAPFFMRMLPPPGAGGQAGADELRRRALARYACTAEDADKQLAEENTRLEALNR